MDFNGSRKPNLTRIRMPIRPAASYMSPQNQTGSSNSPYPFGPSTAHRESSFPSPYSDSTVHSSSSYFQPGHGPQPDDGLASAKPPPVLPGQAVARRYGSVGAGAGAGASYPESQTSDSDRVSMTSKTSTSPVATTVNCMPPMPSSISSNLQPTWHGFIHTTQDALTIVEACLNGTLLHCPRRPHDRERASVIRSGSVFVYEETTSGIKRWTDGLSWSPSRIMGNFLVYRELERPFPPGEKKRANRQRNKSNRSDQLPRSCGPGLYGDEPPFEIPDCKDRKITGSLVDSYDFKRGGLLKRTLSVVFRGCTHHMIAYYTIEDAKDRTTLLRPGHDHRLANCHPRNELLNDQKFRGPIQDPDDFLPYPPYFALSGMTVSVDGHYASHYPHHHHYEPVVHDMPTTTTQPEYHASPQSSISLRASDGGADGSGYSAMPSNPPSPSTVLGSVGDSSQNITRARHSHGLVSPLDGLRLEQTAGHQPRSAFDDGPGDMHSSARLDYRPYPHEVSYTTTVGPTFNRNFSFGQPDPNLPSQQRYHDVIGDINDDSQVYSEHMFGPTSVQPPTPFSCYMGHDSQHSRHDTLIAFDEKLPQYSSPFG